MWSRELEVALAAKKATTTIPIVMTRAGDPVALGLVAESGATGRQCTGALGVQWELITERLEVLKDAVPKLARVGVLLSPAGEGRVLKELRSAAQDAQVEFGGDREKRENSTRTQRFRERFPDRQAEAGGRNYDDPAVRSFWPQEHGSLEACLSKYPVAGYFVRRRSLSMRAVSCSTGQTTLTCIGARRFMWTRS